MRELRGRQKRKKRRNTRKEGDEGKTTSPSLVVEVVDVLHVAEDDVLLAGDARRNLLHTVGHLPQVRLRNTITVSDLEELHFEGAQRAEGVSSPPDTPEGL